MLLQRPNSIALLRIPIFKTTQTRNTWRGHQRRVYTLPSTKKFTMMMTIMIGTCGLIYHCRKKYKVTFIPFPVISCESIDNPPNRKPVDPQLEPLITAITGPHLSETPLTLSKAVEESTDIVNISKDKYGVPGISIAVSIDGVIVWEEGFGCSDVENRIPMRPNAVVQIGSVSKSITSAVVARLWEEGKIDLDKDIQHYVPSFPEKVVDGETVTITSRHLLSHLSGIRHYNKQVNGDFFSTNKYFSATEALDKFKDDPLSHKPGSQYLYTTFGFVLLSAVAEKVACKTFQTLAQELFDLVGMSNSYLDDPIKIIPNRSNFYRKNVIGILSNAPYVDSSYKYAGGGLLSTAGDLIKFGNALLYSYQFNSEMCKNKPLLPGILKKETMEMFWKPRVFRSKTKCDGQYWYGMGWIVLPTEQKYGFGSYQRFCVFHNGQSAGANSCLLIVPHMDSLGEVVDPPKGIVVSVLANVANADATRIATEVAKVFQKVGFINESKSVLLNK